MNWRRRRPAVIAAVVGLLASGALAAAAPAIAAPAPAPGHAAAAAAGPLGKLWRVSNPAAYSRAVRSGNWILTPEGLAYKSCVNHVPPGGKVARDGSIVTRSGAVRRVARCTTPTLTYPGSRAASPGRSVSAPAASTSCAAPTTASWWAGTCARDLSPAGLEYLHEQFSMPSNPAKVGALIFFFPAFEDSTGESIVQPVLSWGANAETGVTSGNVWYLTSWYGNDGTYYVSKSAHVNPPGTVTGEIQRGLCVSLSTGCQWTITTSVGSTSVSLVWPAGPEMTQVFGGVMEVPWGSGCVETPPTGHEAFRNLVVNDSSGSSTPPIQPFKNVAPQCSVTAAPSSGINTDITWAP